MEKYIGFKLIQAEKADRHKVSKKVYPYSEPAPDMAECEVEHGYKVVYPDGYESWSPKDVFESAYMQVGENNTITPCIVEGFIKDTEVITMGNKTTVVKATMINGFEIVESSSCVDPANYNEQLGTEICVKRIKDKLWLLLGFLLQTAKEGIKA